MMFTLCIDNYNHDIYGVVIADQRYSYYDTQLTSFCTWWSKLFWAYDTMVTNAYFICQDMFQSPNTIAHKVFHLLCTWGLILTGSGQISTLQIIQCTRAISTRSQIKESTYLPRDQSWDCGRRLVPLEKGKRLGCWLCCWKHRNNHIQNTKSPPKTAEINRVQIEILN